MIVSNQVQNTMNQKLIETVFEWHSGLGGFPMGGIGGDYHVPKQIRADFGKRAFLHGKRDDIGWTDVIQIGLVEFGYSWIIYDKNGQLGIRVAQGV